MSELPDGLADALDHAARAGTLLVATDFDGVLAPIVPTPEEAWPLPAGVAALESLAALPSTYAALVSGRARDDLAARAGTSDRIRLVGTHGAEIDGGLALTEDQHLLRARVIAELERLARGLPGVTVEVKPGSASLHVRNAARSDAAAALEAVRSGPARWPGVEPNPGKEVLELAVVTTDKGAALRTLRERFGAEAVLYAGDDVTDEKAFAVLGQGDVAVKVGDGPTAATHRLPDPKAVVALFERLLELRRQAVS